MQILPLIDFQVIFLNGVGAGNGTLTLQGTVPANQLPGVVNMQALFVDPQVGLSSTQGLSIGISVKP